MAEPCIGVLYSIGDRSIIIDQSSSSLCAPCFHPYPLLIQPYRTALRRAVNAVQSPVGADAGNWLQWMCRKGKRTLIMQLLSLSCTALQKQYSLKHHCHQTTSELVHAPSSIARNQYSRSPIIIILHTRFYELTTSSTPHQPFTLYASIKPSCLFA